MKDNPFDRLASAYHERASVREEERFEESRVDYLFKALKFSVQRVRAFRAAEEAKTASNRLTLQGFGEEFPSFPILLGASAAAGKKLHLARTAMIPALFKQFGAAPFVAAYEAFYEQAATRADGRSVGLVFPRKGIRHGLIIYSGGLELEVPHSLVWTYTGGAAKTPYHVHVRTFQQLVEAIHNRGHGWRPD